MNKQKNINLVCLTIVLFIFNILGQVKSYADGMITFGPRETKIEGSIRYTVIGQYRAHFDIFKGRIDLAGKSQKVQSVYLEIEAGSIRSRHPWCDKLARSRRLLNTARYPKIIFKSDKIIFDESGYKVKGVLELHGIKRRMIFPFESRVILDQISGRKILVLKGSWDIERKDFNIIWNKYLDHGGLVVSDEFTVNWGIKAYIGKALY